MRALINKRREDNEGGFTLIELLLVIIILGILAAVVVFSVRGVSDRGQSSACKTGTANGRNTAAKSTTGMIRRIGTLDFSRKEFSGGAISEACSLDELKQDQFCLRSRQIVPTTPGPLAGGKDRSRSNRVVQVVMTSVKLDIKKTEAGRQRV